MNATNRDSCHQLLKTKNFTIKITVYFFLLLFDKNRDLYELNSEIRSINTRFRSDLHTPTANLTTFPRGPFYFGIKVFGYLPMSIKSHFMT
jgi:hypothetical protein